MGRVKAELRTDGRNAWTLFDTGARQTYIARAAVRGLPVAELPAPFQVALGGGHHTLKAQCTVYASIEGKPITFLAFVMDTIGQDEDGRDIDVLLGAIEMQRWGIRPVPDEERLDLTHYPKEFVEY